MQTSIESFPFYPQYCFCVLGILISIILPILRRFLPKPLTLSADPPVWKRYAVIGLFSLITAIVVMAISKDKTTSWQWYDALLAGYIWDSTLQKLVNG